MSKRGSKSALFITSLSSSPKGKYKKEHLEKIDLDRRKPDYPSLPNLDGFIPTINFLPKSVIEKKERFDLIYYAYRELYH